VNAASFRTSVAFLLFSAPALATMWRSHRTGALGRTLAVCLLVFPTLFYWCMRLDQNVGFRFFYYIPLSAGILLAVHWRGLGDESAFAVRVGFAAWLVLLAMPLRRELRTFLDLQSPELREIAEGLRRVPQNGALINSEAGILPYYSGWAAIDPWGLNTAEFAHRFFQAGDVERIAPHLIHVHADEDERCIADFSAGEAEDGRTWPHLIRNLVAGADPATYDLWLTSYGSERFRLRKHWRYGEGDRDCWFVRRDAPEHDAIASVLEQHHGVGGAPAQQLEARHVMAHSFASSK
jgi:hypothetical protein